MRERPLVAYEPNPALAWLYDRFFQHVAVDETWVRAVREASTRGTVVYVLRNLSFVDFLALDHLTKRYDLPQVRFANELGLFVLEPMGRGWLEALRPRRSTDDEDDLRRTIQSGSAAALFLKRPGHLLEGKARGKIEGDHLVRAIFDTQRSSERPILLVPQVFVWSKSQDDARHNAIDALFGPREWPGQMRSVVQFLANYRHVTLRSGEPVDVAAFLDGEGWTSEGKRVPDDVLVRRITYSLLRRLERERRTVIGPTKKPADRMREDVVRSPKLQKIIRDMAGEGEHARTVITTRALMMVKELQASLDVNTVASIVPFFEQITSRMYAGFEVDEAGLARLRDVAKDGTIILLPSHKSHVDYLLLTYLFFKNHMQLPLIAAGDNLSFFPLGPVFRRSGAFFIRRTFKGDRLYGAVVDAYIRRLIKDGTTLEFFLEGGRSRTGKLLPPKIGMLSMVVDAALGVTSRPVYFCPISIGYERLVEEGSFVHELSGGEKKKEDIRGLFSTAGLMAGRYGRLNVQFGELLTLENVLRELDGESTKDSLATMTPARRRAVVTRLAYRVMNEINRVTAVTPASLVATVLLAHGRRGLGHDELVRRCEALASLLRDMGARFSSALVTKSGDGAFRVEGIREACELFVRAGHLEAHVPGAPRRRSSSRRRGSEPPSRDSFYVVPDDARMSLDISKNIVVHFFVARGLVATALLAESRLPSGGGGGIPTTVLRDRVRSLSRLFKYEFQFRADASFERIFDDEVASMESRQELSRIGDVVLVGSGDALERVEAYAHVLENFVEAYRIAARGLGALLKGPLPPKDLVNRALAVGERMFLDGEVRCHEAVSNLVLANAYAAFVDQGYVRREDGMLSLPESYANVDAVRTIEEKIAAFLVRKPT
ncbi:MAG: 1-acyl-sn-glycerol-3-phosphate acyltransferase [Polyangiaceae bacterium]